MASDADWWKYQTLPGNERLTFVVDCKAFRITATQRSFQVRFNRNLGTAVASTVVFRFGTMVFQGYEPGSFKSGIELLRPSWRFEESAINRRVMTTFGVPCGGIIRRNIIVTSEAAWTAEGFFFFTDNLLGQPERCISGPIVPVDVYTGGAGDLC